MGQNLILVFFACYEQYFPWSQSEKAELENEQLVTGIWDTAFAGHRWLFSAQHFFTK